MCAQKQAEHGTRGVVPVRGNTDFEIALSSFLYQFEQRLRALDPQTADTEWGRQIVQHFSGLLRDLIERGNDDNTALVLPARGYEQMAEIINSLLSAPCTDCGMSFGEFFGIAPGYIDYGHRVYVFAPPGTRISSQVPFPQEPEVAMVSVEPEEGAVRAPEGGPVELTIYGRAPAPEQEERARWAAGYFFEELYQRLSYVADVPEPTEDDVADVTSTLLTDMQTLWRTKYPFEKPPDEEGMLALVGEGLKLGFAAAVSAAVLPSELAVPAQLGADNLTEMLRSARGIAGATERGGFVKRGGFVIESEEELEFLKANKERFGISDDVFTQLQRQSSSAGSLMALPEAQRTVQIRSDEYMRFLLDPYSSIALRRRQRAGGNLRQLFRIAGFSERQVDMIVVGRDLQAAQNLVFTLKDNAGRPMLERYAVSFGERGEVSAEALFTRDQIEGRARYAVMRSWEEFMAGWRAAREADVSIPRAIARGIRQVMYAPWRTALREIPVRGGATTAAEGTAAREGWLPTTRELRAATRNWILKIGGFAVVAGGAFLIWKLCCSPSPHEPQQHRELGLVRPPDEALGMGRGRGRAPPSVIGRGGLVPQPGGATTSAAGTAEAGTGTAAYQSPLMAYRNLYNELSQLTSPVIAYNIVGEIDKRAGKESRVPALMFLLERIRNRPLLRTQASLNNLLDQWINEHRRP